MNSIGRRNTSDPTGNCVFGAPCPDFIENLCLDIGEGRDAGCQTLREDHPDLNAALSTVTPDGVCIAGSAGAGPAGSAAFCVTLAGGDVDATLSVGDPTTGYAGGYSAGVGPTFNLSGTGFDDPIGVDGTDFGCFEVDVGYLGNNYCRGPKGPHSLQASASPAPPSWAIRQGIATSSPKVGRTLISALSRRQPRHQTRVPQRRTSV